MGVARVMVAVDFRPPALAAARWTAARFADVEAIELTHVTPRSEPGLLPPPGLSEALRGLGSSLGPAPITSKVLAGHRAARLVERAREFDADLVVLGRSTVDGIRGRTIERLVRQLDIPVVAVGCGERSAAERVLAAVDTSAIGIAVAQWGIALARHLGASLTLLHVIPEPADPGWEEVGFDWLQGLGGIAARTSIVRAADAGTGILEAVDSERADLLVVGRNGSDALGEKEIGSATGIVLRRAHIPILVVPRPDAFPPRITTRPRVDRRGCLTTTEGRGELVDTLSIGAAGH